MSDARDRELIAAAYEEAASDLAKIAALTHSEYATRGDPARAFARDAAVGGIQISADYLRKLAEGLRLDDRPTLRVV